MKKIVTFVLLISLIIAVFAGCGAETVEDTSGTTGTKPTEATTTGTNATNPSQPGTEPEEDPEPEDDGFYPVIRFVVASDTHITSADGRQAQRTADMIKQMNAYAAKGVSGYNKLDALLIAGDVTDTGSDSDLRNAYVTIFDNLGDTELVITSGNHEWNTYGADSMKHFESFFGKSSALTDTVINGYHFITTYASEIEFGMYGYEYNQAVIEQTEKLIQEAIADTGKDKPVFIIQHVGNMYTSGGTMATDSSSALNAIYAKYENIVVFSGHSHYPANDPCSIYQQDYTAINTGTLNATGAGLKNGNQKVLSPAQSEYAQCYLVEIDKDNRMRVRCWDILQKKFMGEEWLIESWKKEDFVYTPDRFKAEDIFFAEDAKLELFGAFETSAVLNAPALPANSLPAKAYEAKVYSTDGRLIATCYSGSQYYNEKYNIPTKISLTGLEKDTTYRVEVRGINNLYAIDVNAEGTLRTEALEITFKTISGENANAADLVDLKIDATNKTVYNGLDNGYEPTYSDSVNIAHDATIGRDVLVFDGNPSKVVKFEDYTFIEDELENSLSVELYFKISAFPASGVRAVLGALESGGMGIEVGAGRKAEFLFFDGSTYKRVAFNCEANVYYHVLATYDGSTYTVYLNGQKLGSHAISSFRFTDTAASKCIYFGGDTHWNGEVLSLSNCAVAGFKLYSYALDEAAAAKAYSDMTKK